MRYLAEIFGSSWSRGPVDEFDTITEARRWAESFGSTADSCDIIDTRRWAPRADHPNRVHPVVAVHNRNTNGNGLSWHKSTPPRYLDDGRTVDRDPLASLRWSGGGGY